jgi:hypothetical protein
MNLDLARSACTWGRQKPLGCAATAHRPGTDLAEADSLG